LEDFRVVYFIKVPKLVKLTKFGHFENFRVLYYIKVRRSLKFHTFILLNFLFAILQKSHEVC